MWTTLCSRRASNVEVTSCLRSAEPLLAQPFNMFSNLIDIMIEIRKIIQRRTRLKNLGKILQLPGYGLCELPNFLRSTVARELAKMFVKRSNRQEEMPRVIDRTQGGFGFAANMIRPSFW